MTQLTQLKDGDYCIIAGEGPMQALLQEGAFVFVRPMGQIFRGDSNSTIITADVDDRKSYADSMERFRAEGIAGLLRSTAYPVTINRPVLPQGDYASGEATFFNPDDGTVINTQFTNLGVIVTKGKAERELLRFGTDFASESSLRKLLPILDDLQNGRTRWDVIPREHRRAIQELKDRQISLYNYHFKPEKTVLLTYPDISPIIRECQKEWVRVRPGSESRPLPSLEREQKEVIIKTLREFGVNVPKPTRTSEKSRTRSL